MQVQFRILDFYWVVWCCNFCKHRIILIYIPAWMRLGTTLLSFQSRLDGRRILLVQPLITWLYESYNELQTRSFTPLRSVQDDNSRLFAYSATASWAGLSGIYLLDQTQNESCLKRDFVNAISSWKIVNKHLMSFRFLWLNKVFFSNIGFIDT